MAELRELFFSLDNFSESLNPWGREEGERERGERKGREKRRREEVGGEGEGKCYQHEIQLYPLRGSMHF